MSHLTPNYHRFCKTERRRATIALVASLTLSAMPASPAQDVYRQLTGVVTDRGNEPLKGAIVEVENENTKSVVSYITDREGRFDFKRLREDTDYVIWATYRGTRSKSRELSHFNGKDHPEFKFVIRLD